MGNFLSSNRGRTSMTGIINPPNTLSEQNRGKWDPGKWSGEAATTWDSVSFPQLFAYAAHFVKLGNAKVGDLVEDEESIRRRRTHCIPQCGGTTSTQALIPLDLHP